ncbi:MAG: hypothetical protein P8Y12_00830 [Gammaproteobacteria bacterium]
MQTDTDLPSDVVEAIRANRKIDAIKRLRKHRGIGKLEIESYVRGQPQYSSLSGPKAESNSGRLVLVAFLIGAAYIAYQLLS